MHSVWPKSTREAQRGARASVAWELRSHKGSRWALTFSAPLQFYNLADTGNKFQAYAILVRADDLVGDYEAAQRALNTSHQPASWELQAAAVAHEELAVFILHVNAFRALSQFDDRTTSLSRSTKRRWLRLLLPWFGALAIRSYEEAQAHCRNPASLNRLVTIVQNSSDAILMKHESR